MLAALTLQSLRGAPRLREARLAGLRFFRWRTAETSNPCAALAIKGSTNPVHRVALYGPLTSVVRRAGVARHPHPSISIPVCLHSAEVFCGMGRKAGMETRSYSIKHSVWGSEDAFCSSFQVEGSSGFDHLQTMPRRQLATLFRARACLRPWLCSARNFALLALSKVSEKAPARTVAPKPGTGIGISTACLFSISFTRSMAFCILLAASCERTVNPCIRLV